ncbi:MAG: cytidine deaminase [Alphaproteobacteria bacterium]|nr:cytidine deaminase [Alphaproteobacteria bacterium]
MKEILIQRAKEIAGSFKLNGFEFNSAGTVAAALVTKDGNVYTGICIDVACSMGFCAEHAAIAEMLKNRETQIEMVVALTDKGNIIPPCGRCREFLFQVDRRNIDTKVIVSETEILPLKELLPKTWADVF